MSFLQPLLKTHTPDFNAPRDTTRQARAAGAASNKKREHVLTPTPASSIPSPAMRVSHANLSAIDDHVPTHTPTRPRPEPKPPMFLLTLVGAATASLCILEDTEFAYSREAEQAEEFLMSLSLDNLNQLPPKLRLAIRRLSL